MTDDRGDNTGLTRRKMLKYAGYPASGVVGWIGGATLDSFQRWWNNRLLGTPLGREAGLVIAFKPVEDYPENKDKRLQVYNTGEEDAEHISLQIYFKNEISDWVVNDILNRPPIADPEVKLMNSGGVQIHIDHIPRSQDAVNPITFSFGMNDREESSGPPVNRNISFIYYRYSWTYLGETHHKEGSLELERGRFIAV